MLHISMLSPHPQTPTYLLVCGHTWHRTVVDPIAPAAVEAALQKDKLDLILLTTATELTLASAEILAHRTGAPILAATALQETALPLARVLGDGEIVGLGPLAQTIWVPDGNILCYAVGTDNVLFSGPLFATGVLSHKANRTVLAKLQSLPEDTLVCGGGAHNQPLPELLRAALAS